MPVTSSTSFVAIYHGNSLPQSEIVGVSVSPDLAAYVAARILPGHDRYLPDTESNRRRRRALERLATAILPTSGLTSSFAPTASSRVLHSLAATGGTMQTHDTTPPERDQEGDWLTVADMARELGVSAKRCYQLIEQNRLPHNRLSSHAIRCSRRAWEQWRAQLDAQALAAAGRGQWVEPEVRP